MAELYYPFESINTGTVDEPVYDRAITAEMERSFNKLRYTNGVFSSVGSGLAVSANSNMIVTVGAGGAHIEGAMYVNTAPLNLTVEASNASLNRIRPRGTAVQYIGVCQVDQGVDPNRNSSDEPRSARAPAGVESV